MLNHTETIIQMIGLDSGFDALQIKNDNYSKAKVKKIIIE